MAFTHSRLSLSSRSTGAVSGRTVELKAPAKTFTATVTLVNSTKGSFRMQGSVDGTNWKNIGSAASTISTTGSPLTVTASTTFAFQLVRIAQVSMVTKSSMLMLGSITGV